MRITVSSNHVEIAALQDDLHYFEASRGLRLNLGYTGTGLIVSRQCAGNMLPRA